MNSVVLDASALLALLLGEPGAGEQHFQMSPQRTDRRKNPFRLPPAWAYALCNAA